MTGDARTEEGRYWVDVISYLSEPDRAVWPAGVSVPGRRTPREIDPVNADRFARLAELGQRARGVKPRPAKNVRVRAA